ncbi:MAG: RNA polymerase sigma-70 factor (ECF subfamily) [Parasphingorhabdus sp.]|jgi:RNA polymerase sigma-70 factor (ECF subfamily)
MDLCTEYRVQCEDQRALKRLYDLIGSKLHGVILRILNDKHESEEALQDTFIKIWQKAASYPVFVPPGVGVA